MALDSHYVILIVYASVYVAIVIAVGVYIYFSRKRKEQAEENQKNLNEQEIALIKAKGENLDTMPANYFEQVWWAREIYTAAIVHIYDQATDIAVMVQWGNLLRKEIEGENLEGVDMYSFFIPGLGCIILYRIITMFFALYEDTQYGRELKKLKKEGTQKHADLEKELQNRMTQKTFFQVTWDLFLSALDLYFIKIIYKEFEQEERRPNSTHRSLQLSEALFESMPQVVLQSVFLLRYTASNAEQDTISIAIIIVSMVGSILSISNKYAWFDRQAVVPIAKEFNGGTEKINKETGKRIPYISWKFLLRFVWRWSDLCTRFVIFALLWVSIGGVYILIYIILTYIVYGAMTMSRLKMGDDPDEEAAADAAAKAAKERTPGTPGTEQNENNPPKSRSCKQFWYRFLATTICIVGVLLDYEWHFCILRLIDNGLMMMIVSLALFAQNFNCEQVGCSDNSNRDSDVPIIFTFCLLGIVSYGIELITYPLLQWHYLEIIRKELKGREFFGVILYGDKRARKTPSYYLTYYVNKSDNSQNNGLGYKDIIYFTEKRNQDDCDSLENKLEQIFPNKQLRWNIGDIKIDFDGCKVFKYGISIKILQTVYRDDGVQFFGEKANNELNKYYDPKTPYKYRINKDNKKRIKVRQNSMDEDEEEVSVDIYNQALKVFEEHFHKRTVIDEDSKEEVEWKLDFSINEAVFVVLNIDDDRAAANTETEGHRAAVVAQYRFGQDFKKYNKDVRLINGHDYSDVHETRDQVIIKVIDRFYDDNRTFSAKNVDTFARERMVLNILNQKSSKETGILEYKGWDDAGDAYFIVCKKLFGGKILDTIVPKTNNKRRLKDMVQLQKPQKAPKATMQQLLGYIRRMYEILAYVHANNIVMRNITLESFQFHQDELEDDEPILYLTHYENSKAIINNDEKNYGNIQGKVVYLSPELCDIVQTRRKKTKKWEKNITGKMYMASDVWALGVITYYLITGKHPFYQEKATWNKLGRTLDGIIQHSRFLDSKVGPFPKKEDNVLFVDFMNRVLCAEYRGRATMKEALEHEFLGKKFRDKFEKEEIRTDVIDLLKETKYNSKLHAAITKVRLEQIVINKTREELKMGDIEEVGDPDKIQKTDTQVDRLFAATVEDDMKAQFKRIDLDGDGYTSVEELTLLLTSLGYAENFAKEEAAKLMEELDTNGDGTIDFNEFATAWVQKKLTINDKYAHAIFNVFDENNDGFIDIDELKKVLFPQEEKKADVSNEVYKDETEQFLDELVQDQNTETLRQILDEVDENKDGKISFEEFYKAMTADVEEGKENDTMPFVKKFMDLEFKEINENGDDPKFENKADYIGQDDKPPQNDAVAMLDIKMQDMDRAGSNPNGNGEVTTPKEEDGDYGDGDGDVTTQEQHEEHIAIAMVASKGEENQENGDGEDKPEGP